MTESLPGVRLNEPRLRFDHSDSSAIGTKPYHGLRRHGPYDRILQQGRGGGVVDAVVVRPESAAGAAQRLKDSLLGDRMGRLETVFRLHFLDDIVVQPTADPAAEASAYAKAIAERMRVDGAKPTIAFVLHHDKEYYRRKARGKSPYFSSKAGFLHHRIPTQSIELGHLEQANIKRFANYFVPNILTAAYAKLGGIPWVVEAHDDRPQITLGVGATSIGSGASTKRYLGISTVFRENGSFVLWETTPLQTDLLAYEASLEEAIAQSIDTYETKEGRTVERLTCHISGREAGNREVRAVERGLAAVGRQDAEATVIDIADSREIWLLDGSHKSLRPESGYVFSLEPDGTIAVLHTSGRDIPQSRLPVRPLRLTIKDPRPCDRWLSEYQHLYDLRWMGWQSVGTGSKPATIDYPQQMARLLAGLYEQEEVQAMEVLSQFKSEAWFL